MAWSFNGLSLISAHEDENWLFIPWMLVLVALIVLETAVLMIHKRQTKHEVLRNWEAAFIISFVVRLVVNIVALIIAMYQYKEVRDHKENTSRRRRARAIQNRQRNLTTVTDGRITNTPRVTLKPPPYLEKPPSYCSESPPPTYSSATNFVLDSTVILQDGGVTRPITPPIIPPPDYSLCGDDCYSDFSDHQGAVPPADYSVSGDESNYRNLPCQ